MEKGEEGEEEDDNSSLASIFGEEEDLEGAPAVGQKRGPGGDLGKGTPQSE